MPTIAPPFSPVNANPAVTNWDPRNNLQKTRAALNRVRASQGHMTINLYGHSGMVGVGAGTLVNGNYVGGGQPYNIGAALARALNGYGVSTRNGGWFGTGNLSLTDYESFDTRLTNSTGWAKAAGGNNTSSFGSGMVLQSTTTATALAFAPTESWDRIVTNYAQYSGGGTFTVDTGGAALTTQSTTNASQAFGSVTTSAASDIVQTANVKATVLGSGVYIIGQETYRSTVFQARVRSIGWNGGLSSDLSNTAVAYNTRSALGSLGGDLTVIMCMLNDFHTVVPISTFQANLQAIATTAQANGDVILLVDWSPGSWSLTGIASYIAAIYAAGAALNVPVVDITKRIGADSTAATALSYFCPDLVHYNATGYGDVGSWLGRLIACGV